MTWRSSKQIVLVVLFLFSPLVPVVSPLGALAQAPAGPVMQAPPVARAEVSETDEEAMVAKWARVVEEGVVRKDVAEQTETV